MNVASEYYFGKGKVSLCERATNGSISKAIYVGNCPELKFSASAEKVSHIESQSGLNVQDREIVKAVTMEMSLTLESATEDNLALLLWGTSVDIALAAAQSHFFPTGIAVNETHVIPNGFNLTVPVVKDSAGAPATLVLGTNYEIDAAFGAIKFINLGAFVQPFEVEYTRGAAKSVPFFTGVRPARFLRFEGLNLGNPGTSSASKYLVELYNIGFDPVSDLSLIGDDFGKFELKGSVQSDDTRVSNTALGGFGRIIKF